MIRITISLATLALVAACETPNAPSVSATDVGRAFAEAEAISRLQFTDSIDLPTGATTYNGQFGANVRGDVDGSLLGDMRMEVAFADDGMSGDITNINLIDPDGRPNQRLDGKLDITGLQEAGRLDGFASGDLRGVDQGSFVDTNVLLVLDGDVFNDRGLGDAVFGSATGDGIGQDPDDWDIEIDGVFFGTAD